MTSSEPFLPQEDSKLTSCESFLPHQKILKAQKSQLRIFFFIKDQKSSREVAFGCHGTKEASPEVTYEILREVMRRQSTMLDKKTFV